MSEYQLTKNNLSQVFGELQKELEANPVLIVEVKSGDTGKWGLARLWRAWMASTAKWMANNGARMPLVLKTDGSGYGSREFNASDAHELFTHQHLGADIDGNRLSWAKKSHDGMRAATKGERFNAMQKHEMWASERGIILMVPRDSDYFKMTGQTTS